MVPQPDGRHQKIAYTKVPALMHLLNTLRNKPNSDDKLNVEENVSNPRTETN